MRIAGIWESPCVQVAEQVGLLEWEIVWRGFPDAELEGGAFLR